MLGSRAGCGAGTQGKLGAGMCSHWRLFLSTSSRDNQRRRNASVPATVLLQGSVYPNTPSPPGPESGSPWLPSHPHTHCRHFSPTSEPRRLGNSGTCSIWPRCHITKYSQERFAQSNAICPRVSGRRGWGAAGKGTGGRAGGVFLALLNSAEPLGAVSRAKCLGKCIAYSALGLQGD